ncbi:MAG: hypothetical protein WC866_01800 [Patescibacteria group bacterium]|jgi:cell division protease FtsH
MTPANDPFLDLLDLINQFGQGQRTTPRSSPESSDLDSAHHEAGHAIVVWYSPFVSSVESVTIERVGVFGGQVLYTFEKTETSAQLYDSLVGALGGLAGALLLNNKVRGGHFTNDLVEARELAEKLATHHESMQLKHLRGGVNLRFDVAAMYRAQPSLRARAFMNDTLEEARGRLRKHQDAFARLVLELMKRKTLKTDDLLRVLGPRLWSPR